MEERTTTINILYGMRTKLQKRIQHHKVVSFSLLGILIIQFILFTIVEQFNTMGISGSFLAFSWCIYEIFTMMKIREEQNNIDVFYLMNLSNGDKK